MAEVNYGNRVAIQCTPGDIEKGQMLYQMALDIHGGGLLGKVMFLPTRQEGNGVLFCLVFCWHKGGSTEVGLWQTHVVQDSLGGVGKTELRQEN